MNHPKTQTADKTMSRKQQEKLVKALVLIREVVYHQAVSNFGGGRYRCAGDGVCYACTVEGALRTAKRNGFDVSGQAVDDLI